MAATPRKLYARSKIWIEDDYGEVVFGLGRLRILSAIEEHGSIDAAARELGMSYRAVWGKIRATEQRLGKPLVKLRAGAGRSGGSELTPFAKSLVDQFRRLQSSIETSANASFEDLFIDHAPGEL